MNSLEFKLLQEQIDKIKQKSFDVDEDDDTSEEDLSLENQDIMIVDSIKGH